MIYRTDRNNNPAAITTEVANQAGLVLEHDYVVGDPFEGDATHYTYFTAKLLGDPVEITCRVIDRIGYFTHTGAPRWTYIALPHALWLSLTPELKRDVIGYHYAREGGTGMIHLFPNYAKWKI